MCLEGIVRAGPALGEVGSGVFAVEVFESGTPIQVTVVRAYEEEAWASAVQSMEACLAGTAMVGLYAPPVPGIGRMHREYERLRKLLPLAVTVYDPGTVHSADEVGIFGL